MLFDRQNSSYKVKTNFQNTWLSVEPQSKNNTKTYWFIKLMLLLSINNYFLHKSLLFVIFQWEMSVTFYKTNRKSLDLIQPTNGANCSFVDKIVNAKDFFIPWELRKTCLIFKMYDSYLRKRFNFFFQWTFCIKLPCRDAQFGCAMTTVSTILKQYAISL